MSELLINPKSEELIHLYSQNPAHAVIISGAVGSGTDFAAKRLINQAFPGAHVKILEKGGEKSIGIEKVRESLKFLKIKSTNAAARILVVRQAELLTEDAQNALLKTLEEPASNSAIILLTSSTRALLTTIQSRAVCIDILPISFEQARINYGKISESELKRHYSLSEGNAELLEAIVNDADHPLVLEIENAKIFLTQSAFERVKAIENQKDSADQLIDSIIKIAKTALSAKSISRAERQRWIRIYESATESKDYMQAYVSKKAVMLNLALNLN